MPIDSSNFPFVWISFDHHEDHDDDKEFADFERLLARRQVFILLSENAMEGMREHQHEERKRISLWMKKNKEDLRAFVKAMILIAPGTAQRVAIKALATVFGQFWGYPLMAVASRAEALELAERLIANDPTAAGVAE